MQLSLYVAILLFTSVSFLLPILFWKSKKNIDFFIGLPMTIIAYIGGGLYFIDNAKKVYGIDDYTMEFYAIIMLIGTMVYLVFYTIGVSRNNYVSKKILNFISFFWTQDRDLSYSYIRAGEFLAFLGIVCIGGSFIGMGFVPLFSENPMMAKYMAGEFQDIYRAYAVPYRMGLDVANIAIMLLALGVYCKPNIKGKLLDASLIVILVLLLIGTMRRGIVVSGLVNIVFIFAAFKSKKKFSMIVFLYLLFFCFGSAANSIMFYLVGITDAVSIEDIFKGAPDIQDQLFFLQCWIDGHFDFTYGTNIIGGLIPFHSIYNLSAYTLAVTGSEAGVVASGGFRLTIPIISFIMFGWIGIVVVCGIVAYIQGVSLQIKKKYLASCSLIDYFTFVALIKPFIALINSVAIGISIDTLFETILTMLVMIVCRYKVKLFA